MRVLVTRPLEDAQSTAILLAQAGHLPVLAPLMTVQFLDADLPGDVSGLVATSANGVRGFCCLDARRDLPLYAVGTHTADVARNAGFADVRHSDGDAAALADAIAGWARPGPLLHLAGRDRSDVLAQSLVARGFALHTATLYNVTAAMHFPATAIAALAEKKLDAALFYSPRSAKIFAACAAADGLSMTGLVAACLSPAVAKELDGLEFQGIRIAAQPSQESLLSLL